MMEKKHHGRQLTVAIRTKAWPDQVWQAWTDPETSVSPSRRCLSCSRPSTSTTGFCPITRLPRASAGGWRARPPSGARLAAALENGGSR